MMEQITTLNDAQLPIPALKTGYVRDTILYTLFNPILQAILVDYRWEELKSESTFNTIPFFAYDVHQLDLLHNKCGIKNKH